jgi:hypothetical protein
MSIVRSGNGTHDTTVAVAEAARQGAVAGASQSAVRAAEITFYRAAIVSAQANGVNDAQFRTALRELGTGGA